MFFARMSVVKRKKDERSDEHGEIQPHANRSIKIKQRLLLHSSFPSPPHAPLLTPTCTSMKCLVALVRVTFGASPSGYVRANTLAKRGDTTTLALRAISASTSRFLQLRWRYAANGNEDPPVPTGKCDTLPSIQGREGLEPPHGVHQ